MGDTSFEHIQDTQTLIGSRKRKLLDFETGEVMEVEQITKRVYGTKNFWKCYLMDFLSVLGMINNKQLDVFIYIVEHTQPSDNLFFGTYADIEKHVGVSRPTIATVMKKLQEYKFIKKVSGGVWFVNPDILMKGNDTKRQLLLSYYNSDEPMAPRRTSKITKKKTKKEAEKKTEEGNEDA